jgi:hypothetical protein
MTLRPIRFRCSWDANLTIPATQPIRTSNGYAYRNGTPALLYTAGAFSITIRNKRNEFVLYSPVGYGFDPAAVSASVVKNDFIGDGVEVAFVLSACAKHNPCNQRFYQRRVSGKG